MLGTGCTVTESLFCNLKWLLLSSRLQASCCPRSWSLRSKMRLPQCCESGPTGEEEGRKELTALYSAPLTSARTSFFTATVSIRLSSSLILNVLLPMGIKVWCTSLCYSNSHHMQSAKCIFIGFWTWFLYWSWHEDFISEKVFIFKCDIC